MSEDLHPTEGARYLLELTAGDEQRATFHGAIFTPEECFDYDVELDADGSYQLDARGVGAGAELEKRLGNFARQLARAARGNVEDGLPPWPQRILRWRGPGRG